MTPNAVQSQEQTVPAGALEGLSDQQAMEYFNPDLPDFGQIGDDPTSHGQASAYLTRIATESHSEDWADRIKNATSNAVAYEHGYDPKPADDAVVSNEIQPAVISITDIETREPINVIIRPVETRDKAQVFWIGPQVDPAMFGMPPGIILALQTDPQTGQIAPMDDLTAFIVRKAASTGAFPLEWLCVLDDRLVADVYQTIFDLLWMESGTDDFIYSNVLMTNVYGWQVAWYGWDSLGKKHLVENISIKEVYLDPQKMEMDKMGYMMFDMVMDIDRAKAMYPQLVPLIDQYSTMNSPKPVDSNTEFGLANSRAFYRRTVTFRLAFFKNQMVPMTQAEAEAAGLIQSGPDAFTGQPVHQLTDLGWMHTTGKTETDNIDPQTGQMAQGQWPKTIGIRQIATIAQTRRIVQDIRCEHFCEPMLLNVCIPVPSSPYGQGIPEKLKSMQAADIRLLTALVQYAETYANPGCIISESVAGALKGGLNRTFVDPKETIVAPDDLYQRFGEKMITWFVPPAMPPAIPQAMQIMKEKRGDTSGHPEVLEGTAPSAQSSGKQIELLQNAVTSQFGFQAQWTRKMVLRLARLMHYSHLWRLDISDVMKIYSRLPEPIMALVIEKARTGKWDIAVDVSNGTSSQSDKKLKRAIALNGVRSATGEPAMSMTTLRNETGLDAEQESILNKQDMGLAGVAPQPMQQQQPAQYAGNGNGRMNGG